MRYSLRVVEDNNRIETIPSMDADCMWMCLVND